MKTNIKSLVLVLTGSIYGVMLFVSSICSAASYPTSTATPLANDLSMNQYKLTDVGDIITKGPWADVRAYGAVGDGVTDDTTSIQNAINAAVASGGGGTVYLPTGTYKVTNTLTINGKINFIGAGRDRTYINSSAIGERISITNGDYSVFQDFTLSRPGSGNIGSYGIKFQRMIRGLFNRVNIEYVNGPGIAHSGVENGASNVFRELHLANNTIGIDLDNFAGDSSIVDSIFQTNSQYGVRLTYVLTSSLRGNYFTENTQGDLLIDGSVGVDISGNGFEEHTVAVPFFIKLTSTGNWPTGIHIAGNWFESSGHAGRAIILDAYDAYGITIVGNKLGSNYTGGIPVYSTSHVYQSFFAGNHGSHSPTVTIGNVLEETSWKNAKFMSLIKITDFYVDYTNGNVGIGTVTPNAKALLDLSSTTKGFLPPRMTTTERDAIGTPPEGLMIYNTTTKQINFYDGLAWRVVSSN